MGEQILVALKGNDRLEQIIPYLENVARPGMKVVFLIHYPVTGGSQRLRDHWVTAESVEGARFAGEKIRETHWLEEQGRLAEHKVFLAQEALRKRGVEIVVDVYTGSLRRAVKSYVRKGGIHLIMMRARTSLAMMKLLPRVVSLFGLFQQSSFFPMLLLHPDQVV
jgi:hypothetical protein